jgi:hypothetical protein
MKEREHIIITNTISFNKSFRIAVDAGGIIDDNIMKEREHNAVAKKIYFLLAFYAIV